MDSTNLHLARLRAAGKPVQIVLAETQTAGRGRRGRHWLSPPGCGLYLSWFHHFEQPAGQLGALGLVAGLAAANAVAKICAITPGLKWPNDLLINGRKAGGCLADLSPAKGICSAIIGVGINVDFNGLQGPDQPWTDLTRETGQRVDRDRLAGALIHQLGVDIALFERAGLAPFRRRWEALDVLRGRPVQASGALTGPVIGVAEGIDDQGRLLVRSGEKWFRLPSGEISLRTTE